MPSFDIISEVDLHEVGNAVDQASREVGTRFDFKGSNAQFTLNGTELSLAAESDFQLQQMREILYGKFAKRGVDTGSLKTDPPQSAGRQVKQTITLIQGIESTLAKKIVKLIKDSKMKVQAAIQGDKVRVTGKKRDDLQECIAFLRGAGLDQPLQFDNFRD
jgi:uncharacterized protein YajQ (UPF0234 family)